MKLLLLGLVLFTAAGANAGEFRLQSWKKPANWKCQMIEQGAMTCRSKIPGQSQAKMTLRVKKASASDTLATFRPSSSNKIYFAQHHEIHGRKWMDSLYQSSDSAPLVRSAQTLFTFERKKMAFEVVVEAPEETYQSIESVVNRSIASIRLPSAK